MASVNKVILVGNLGRDPEVRYSPDGAAICNVSIATTSQWKDKNSGEKREDTEWHRVVFYNKQAELVGEHAKKGESLYVEGRIKTRKYQDKETGAEKFSTEIIAERFQFNGGRSDSEQSDAPAPARQPTARQQAGQGGASRGAGSIADFESDVPF